MADLLEEDTGKKPVLQTPDEKRNRKIAKYKRDKELNDRLQILRRILISKVKLQDENTEVFDQEEDIREMTILQLQSFAREAVDELNIIKQEIQILTHMQATKDQEAVSGRKEESISIGRSNDAFPSSVICGGSFGGRDFVSGPTASGLNITKLNKTLDGQIVMSRETIKASVFTPRMSGT